MYTIPRCKTEDERKQRRKDARRRYYEKNKDKISEYNKKYYDISKKPKPVNLDKNKTN